jgi:hypothetical protein
MQKVTPAEQRSLNDSLTADRIMYLCERMLRLFQRTGYKYSCMRRSIVLYHFLRSYGVAVIIHFGAKWDGPALAGHSWLTLDEEILLDSHDNVGQFALFYSFPRGREEASGVGAPGDKELAAQEKISFD